MKTTVNNTIANAKLKFRDDCDIIFTEKVCKRDSKEISISSSALNVENMERSFEKKFNKNYGGSMSISKKNVEC